MISRVLNLTKVVFFFNSAIAWCVKFFFFIGMELNFSLLCKKLPKMGENVGIS